MKVLVTLATGFEEIEAITVVDILRRVEIDVTTAYLDENPVIGSHNISINADKCLSDLKSDDFDCIILPGGLPGSENLKNDDTVISFVKNINSRGGYVAAICAAPIVLGHAGIVEGKNATCYPGFEGAMKGANYTSQPAEVDGNIITGKGPGCSIPFALEIVKALKGEEVMTELKNIMQIYWM